jgi:RNA polymerase sigma-70 factor, ECF subfamily
MGLPLSGSIADRLFSAPAADARASTFAAIEADVMALFDEFRNPILRYALSFGLTLHDAEEVAQEVFLSLFQHLRTGKSRKNLRGWLFRVAHNLSLKRRHANQLLHRTVTSDRIVAENQLDPSPDPETQLSFSQRQRRLRAAVTALPETDQFCLRLRAEGLRYREIARIVGISLGAVSISLTQSLARLIRADGCVDA